MDIASCYKLNEFLSSSLEYKILRVYKGASTIGWRTIATPNFEQASEGSSLKLEMGLGEEEEEMMTMVRKARDKGKGRAKTGFILREEGGIC